MWNAQLQRRLPAYLAVGALAACVLLAGNRCGGQPVAPPQPAEVATGDAIELDTPSAAGPPTAAELNEVRMIFEDLDEQLRIGTAKLGDEALERKRDIGRLRVILTESDQQIRLLAAKILRLQERHEQLQQDLASRGAAGPPAAKPSPLEPAARLLLRLGDEQSRLEQLTHQRSRIKQRLDDLYDRHIQSLLEAGMTIGSDTPPAGGLDQLLHETLEGVGPATP